MTGIGIASFAVVLMRIENIPSHGLTAEAKRDQNYLCSSTGVEWLCCLSRFTAVALKEKIEKIFERIDAAKIGA